MFGTASWKVIRIRGIDLKIHISLLILLAYTTFIAVLQLPLAAQSAGVDPYELTLGRLSWGILFSLAILVSVALHEFGHALTAQSLGIQVKGITLMMLGGVSEMSRIPESRYSEFKLAIIGPVVSLGIAALMYLLNRSAETPDLILFGHWLGYTNLALAVFNLLPAFPLDGGRALRSVLATRVGTLRATRTAVNVSRVFAWVLGLFGAFTFNFLLILIAFFIYSAAQAELSMLISRGLLGNIRVGDLGVRLTPMHESQSIDEAASEMMRVKSPVLPVSTASGSPALIFLDSIKMIPKDSRDRTYVRDVQITANRSVELTELLKDVIPDLATAPLGVLPMTDGNRLIGLLRSSDLAQFIQLKSLEASDSGKRAA